MTVDILVGAHVVTSDGQELGKVKQVEPSAFHLDVPHHADYWLESALVASVTDGRLELSIEASQVGAYKMDRPHDHNQFQAGTPSEMDRATVQGNALRDSNRSSL
jgi:hypothetical protein